jgi:hypothetical protein
LFSLISNQWLISGVGSVLFAINVDSADFNEGDPGLFGDHAESLLGKSEPIITSSNCGNFE